MQLPLLLALAAAARVVAAVRTEVPGRDGAAYLWMAERAAAGEVEALFATVFHPLYPALTAGVLRVLPGLDPVHAGQLAAGACGALALVPLWLLAHALFGPRAAWWSGLAYALGSWFCHHPAECMSEGPYYLAVAAWAWALAAGPARPAVAGLAAAAGYLARPEGAALVVLGAAWLLVRRELRLLRRYAIAALPVAALLPLGYAALGSGFTLTPKAAFNYEVGVGGAPSPIAHWFGELARLPLDAAEGLAAWLPLAIAGAVRWRPRRLGDPGVLLLAPFVVQCLVVPLLRSHPRFVSGHGVLLLPYAGVSAAALLAWLAARRRWLPWLGIALLLLPEARLFRPRNADRAIERDLGRWLGARLQPGETLASDMPRLVYFAGRKPPPPRPIAEDELRALAALPQCRFVALVEDRTDLSSSVLAELGLEPLELPALLSGSAGRERVRLYEKRPTTR